MRTHQNIRWLRPPTGWMKLNTDGSVPGNPGQAGAGDVCMDQAILLLLGVHQQPHCRTEP